MRIDLTEIRNVLANVEQILSRHHGKDVHNSSVMASQQGGTIRLNGVAATEFADDLRVVQDYLRLADGEVAALYWMCKGREDPRRPAGTHAPGRPVPLPGPRHQQPLRNLPELAARRLRSLTRAARSTLATCSSPASTT